MRRYYIESWRAWRSVLIYGRVYNSFSGRLAAHPLKTAAALQALLCSDLRFWSRDGAQTSIFFFHRCITKRVCSMLYVRPLKKNYQLCRHRPHQLKRAAWVLFISNIHKKYGQKYRIHEKGNIWYTQLSISQLIIGLETRFKKHFTLYFNVNLFSLTFHSFVMVILGIIILINLSKLS